MVTSTHTNTNICVCTYDCMAKWAYALFGVTINQRRIKAGMAGGFTKYQCRRGSEERKSSSSTVHWQQTDQSEFSTYVNAAATALPHNPTPLSSVAIGGRKVWSLAHSWRFNWFAWLTHWLCRCWQVVAATSLLHSLVATAFHHSKVLSAYANIYVWQCHFTSAAHTKSSASLKCSQKHT